MVPSHLLHRYSSSFTTEETKRQHKHHGLQRYLHSLTPATESLPVFSPACPALAPARAQGPHQQPVQASA